METISMGLGAVWSESEDRVGEGRDAAGQDEFDGLCRAGVLRFMRFAEGASTQCGS